MTSQPLYNLRVLAPGHFVMAKFDSSFNVEATYNLHAKGVSYTCDCPANSRSVVLRPCKHKRMMPYMLGAMNTDRFFEPTTGTWHQPLARELMEMADGPELEQGYHGFESKAAYEAHYSDPKNYAAEIPAMEAYVKEAEAERELSSEARGSSAEAPTIATYIELDDKADVAEEFSKLLHPTQPQAAPAPTIRRR